MARPGFIVALAVALFVFIGFARPASAQAAGWAYFEGELTGVAGNVTVCPYEEGVSYPLPLPYSPKCADPYELRTFDVHECGASEACYFSDTYAALATDDGGSVPSVHTISAEDAATMCWLVVICWAGVWAFRMMGKALISTAGREHESD